MNFIDSVKNSVVPIHREGWRFIAISVAATLILSWFWSVFFWIGMIITGWICYFFRDPERIIPIEEGIIISPADGKVSQIAPVVPPAELELGDKPMMRVSVFMNVFNCHINRAPASGKVTKVTYRKGKFLNAELDKASEFNERNGLVLETNCGKIAVVQIAGLVARRIICNVSEGRDLSIGERFGLIRFGSRLDVYFPADAKTCVSIGQTMIAGETIITNLNDANLKQFPYRKD